MSTDVPAGIYVSSSWKFTYGEQRLQGCDTFIRACTIPNATLRGVSNPYHLTGKLPADHLAACKQRSASLTDIRMEI